MELLSITAGRSSWWQAAVNAVMRMRFAGSRRSRPRTGPQKIPSFSSICVLRVLCASQGKLWPFRASRQSITCRAGH